LIVLREKPAWQFDPSASRPHNQQPMETARWRVGSVHVTRRCNSNEGVCAMGRKLYVGNLAFDVTQQDLQDVFAAIGSCESVALISDRDSGQSRGFGFVEMISNAEAQKAMRELDGKEIKGRAIK